MASIRIMRRPLSRRAVILCLLAFATALRLVPSGAMAPLDSVMAQAGNSRATAPRADSVPAVDENFPGSAYFMAEGAFAPVTGTGTDAPTGIAPGDAGPHVLMLAQAGEPVVTDLSRLSAPDRARALQCLTNAIYYEAGNEPVEGQRAVAQVVLNRLASPLWPNSICGVVYQGGERADLRCQFSFSCDGSMARVPSSRHWSRAWQVASDVLAGERYAPAGLATFYHTLAVHPPWADRLTPVAVIGAHIFYRMPGAAGERTAFVARHSGYESAVPGPFAYRAPDRPLPVLPAGPAVDWLTGTLPLAAASASATIASSASPSSPTPMTAPALGATQWSGAGAQPHIPPQSGGAPGLPSSRIRPEFLTSGRPLQAGSATVR